MSQSASANSDLEAFPIPPLAQSFPSSTAVRGDVVLYPGVTHESTQALRRLLEENDRRFHIYRKISFHHNHLTHHLLAAYSLGASPSHLQAIFDEDVPGMAPLERSKHYDKDGGEEVLKSPGLVNEDNWWDSSRLGDIKYYAAYLQFFHQQVDSLGPTRAFEKYVLSEEANAGPKNAKTTAKPPGMFFRFLGGVLHPFIHTGYGIEFHDRVMLAEGLAQAAVHTSDILVKLFEEGWPNSASTIASATVASAQSAVSVVKDTISNLDKRGRSSSPYANLDTPAPRHLSSGGPSLLELYGQICASTIFNPGPYDPDALISARLRTALEGGRAEELRRIVNQWVLAEGFTERQWEEKYEEIAVFATLLACSTSRPGRDIRVDFFLMHCLTSSIFLPTIAKLLSPPQRVVLVRSYVLVTLHTALSRGRPRIYPEMILEHTSFPAPPKSDITDESKLQIVGHPANPEATNPWLPVVQNAMYALDSHVLKATRSLLHYSTLYGHHPVGSLLGAYKSGSDSAETIPGTGKLSGDIFQKGAGIIMLQTGWVREGQEARSFDTSALGWDGAWEKPEARL